LHQQLAKAFTAKDAMDAKEKALGLSQPGTLQEENKAANSQPKLSAKCLFFATFGPLCGEQILLVANC
jgi:hypothetical protein